MVVALDIHDYQRFLLLPSCAFFGNHHLIYVKWRHWQKAVAWQETITWTNVDQVMWHHKASLGFHVFMDGQHSTRWSRLWDTSPAFIDWISVIRCLFKAHRWPLHSIYQFISARIHIYLYRPSGHNSHLSQLQCNIINNKNASNDSLATQVIHENTSSYILRNIYA